MTAVMNDPLNCPQCGRPLPAGALQGLCPACLLQQGAATESGAGPESQPFEPLPVAEIGRLFPQLEVLELIGKGGMGAVYKARQPNLDRIVALKILPPERVGGPSSSERFNREARALARLSHPNIVAVHEFGQAGALRYLVMEYVDGVNLRQLQRANRLAPREALSIVPQICDALQYAHDEGIVHRDIKPENVLIDRKGRVKIADFGLAKMLGPEPSPGRLTGEGQIMGTPHYMAPEQVEHPLEVDHRADIYALGVVFYEMLTGELPLGKFPPPSRKVQLDVRLDDVVLRTLEKEPERRYQQASQVKTAVSSIEGTTAQPTCPPLAATPTPPDPERPGDFWRRVQFRYWPPLVGLSAGQRVVNWPAIWMRGARVLLMGIWLALITGFVIGRTVDGRTGFLVALAEFTLVITAGPLILALRVFRRLAAPASMLPRLDEAPGGGTRVFEAGVAGIARRAGIAGAAVASTVLALAAAVTLGLLPRSYVGIAQIQVEKTADASALESYDPYFLQTQAEVIRSPAYLEPVIEQFALQREWASRYGNGDPLTRDEALDLLRRRLEFRQTRNTSMIEIRCYDEDPRHAAAIANAVAESYCARPRAAKAELVSPAVRPVRPVRPNIPLNLLVGGVAGLILGAATAAIVLIAGLLRRTRARTAAASAANPRP